MRTWENLFERRMKGEQPILKYGQSHHGAITQSARVKGSGEHNQTPDRVPYADRANSVGALTLKGRKYWFHRGWDNPN